MFNEIADKMDALCRETGQASQDAYTRLQAAEKGANVQMRPDESPAKFQARKINRLPVIRAISVFRGARK